MSTSRLTGLVNATRTTFSSGSKLAGTATITLTAALLAGLGVVALTAVVYTWQLTERARASDTSPSTDMRLGPISAVLSAESATLLLVVSVSALGSFVHAATSFVSYVGNRDLRRSWILWYLFRVPIGGALAVVGYFALRAGLLSGADPDSVNVFGVAALAGLTGLFSKQATDKLREVFDVIFRVAPEQGDRQRADKITTGLSIDRALPSALKKAQIETVHLIGREFSVETTVHVNGNVRPTTVIDPTALSFTVSPEDVAQVGQLEITVHNPMTGAASNTAIMLVT